MQRNPISWAIAAYRSLPLLNVSDTWLCFLLSIISKLTVIKQNDCVKDTKIFVRSLFQAIRLWLMKIKIATVEYSSPSSQPPGDLKTSHPPPPPKKKKKKKKEKKKNPAKEVDVEKNPFKLKKSPPLPPSLLSLLKMASKCSDLGPFRLSPSTQYSV